MVLVQKSPFFELSFFRQYSQGKVLLRQSKTKQRLSRLSKQEIQKVEKLKIFQRVHSWFWSKNGHFSNFVFLGKIGQENVFYDILERKNAFLG